MALGWSALRSSWPELPGKERELAWLAAVRQGHFLEPDWFSITIEAAQHELTISASMAPLRIGVPGDSIQAAMSQWGGQKVADALGTVIGTPKLYDACTLASLQFGSFFDGGKATARQIWSPTTEGAPSTTTALEEASRWRDALELEGMQGGLWKEWINDNRLLSPASVKYGKAQGVNYGFWTLAKATAPPTPGPRPSITMPNDFRVWQQPGTFHDFWHSDYSQLQRLIYRDGYLVGPTVPAGELVELEQIATDPELWPLVRHDGPGPLRHPWIPFDDDGGTVGPLVTTPGKPAAKASSWAKRAAAGIVGAGVMAAAVAYEVKL